jgi:aminopeptidase N
VLAAGVIDPSRGRANPIVRDASVPTGKLRSVALIILLLVLVGAGAPARPVHAASQAPAASYRLDATVDLDKATVAASETVQYRNVLGVPLDSLVFRVVPNATGVIDLGSIAVDGQPVERKLDGSVLELPLASPLAPGTTTTVALTFTLHVPNEPGRLSATARGMTLGSWFPLLAVHREDWDRRQFVEVGDAIFSEVADYDVTIATTTPAQVVATGQRVEQNGQRSRFTASSVRDFAAAISADYVVRQSTVNGVSVEAAAYSDARAAYFASRAADFLRWAGDKLGAYPYPTLTIADTDLPASYGGLEYPGMALISRAYGVGSPPEGSTLDSLLLHEIMHQWFYSLVGNDQIADPWLDEAFVTYVTYSYYREVRPDLAPAVYDRTIAGTSTGYVDTTVDDYSTDGPYFGVVYRRGARFLERLQDTLGDSAFWALLHEHVDTYRDRIASPRAFLDRAQSLTKTPLGPLISEYFSYGAFSSATPRTWTLDAPASPWTGSAALTVAADFPIARVQVWLDQRLLADGTAGSLTLDLTSVEAGSYVLLVRIWDPDGILFERGRRIEVIT